MKKGHLSSLVSIGIPTYNRSNELLRTINDIKKQTYVNLEIIICDNGGSVDKQVLAMIKGDKRFKVVVNEENIGLLKNTEKVLRLARGKYFCWFSDDDWHSEDFVKSLMDTISDHPDASFVFCDFSERLSQGDVVRPLRNNFVKKLQYMTSKNKFYRLLRFFVDDQADGKCNAFYGIFRTDELKALDFKTLSASYTNFGMDNNIVFQMLNYGPAIVIKDRLLSLQCENKKFYNVDRPSGFIRKFGAYIRNIFGEFIQLRSLSGNLIQKIVLSICLPIKLLMNTLSRFFRKLKIEKIRKSKSWQIYHEIIFKEHKIELDLPDVTLVCVATKDVERSVLAMKYSMLKVRFGAALFFSHYKPQNIGYITHIKIDKFKSVEDWGKFIVFGLHDYINTDFIILIHDDGFVVNPNQWTENFKKYDYIGAPWPYPKDNYSYKTETGELVRVGNSVSLRSKRLLKLPKQLGLNWNKFNGFMHEDGFLNVQHRNILKRHGIVYAEPTIAAKFGRENCNTMQEPFTFHKWKGKNKNFPNFSLIE